MEVDTSPPGTVNEKNLGVITGDTSSEEARSITSDDERLVEMGYKPELHRKFGLLSCIAFGFTITNSHAAAAGALGTGIANGGAVIFIWGSWLMLAIHLCVGSSLGELASAYPHAGGQYYWVSQLAPKSCRRFLSYVTGIASWAGAVLTGASVCLLCTQMIFGIVLLHKPDFVYKQWMGFLGYQLLNALIFSLNCWAHLLPYLNKGSLYLSLTTFLVATIALLAVSPKKASAYDVFGAGGYVNMSGWTSDAANVFTGLLGVNWGFSCLDSATHVAEEIPNPSKNIPKAILTTVIIGFITSWVFCIAVFFTILDKSVIIATPTYIPILEVYYRAFKESATGASIMLMLLFFVLNGSLMAIHTWQSRLAWSFARDNGFPASVWLSKVAPAPQNVPFNAHIFSSFWIAVLGVLYVASTTAFNSLVTGGILMQYISYMIPVGILMASGRKLERRGWFWMGPKDSKQGGILGWVANSVVMIWGCFTCVVYSFPYVMPVKAGNMNYVSLVMVLILLWSGLYWVFKAKRTFKTFDRLDGDQPIPTAPVPQ